MNILIEGDRLSAALRSLMRLAQPEVVHVSIKEKQVILTAAGESSAARMKIDLSEPSGEQSGKEITVSISLLSNILDKRKDVKLEIKGSTLFAKAKGGFLADVIGVEDQPVVVVPKEILDGETGFVISNKFMNGLLGVLPSIELKPLLSTYSDVPIGIRATASGTFVACFDFVQTAYVFLEQTTGDFEFLLPSVSQFNMLVKELAGQKYKLVITDNSIYAFNSDMQVSLSLPQQDGDQVLLQDVVELSQAVEKTKFKTIIFNTKEIKDFLSNSRFVYDKDSVFTVKTDGDKALIELKATVGNTSLKTKLGRDAGKIAFNCDLNFFAAVINRAKGNTVSIKITEELIKVRDGDVNYLITLV